MELVPYDSFAGATFGQSVQSLTDALGVPGASGRTDKGILELDYGVAIYRFDGDDRLVEITGDAAVLVVAGDPVPFEALSGFMLARDPDAFECYGFLVSPALGMMQDPGYPSWVTALRNEAVDGLRAMVD